MSVTAVSFTHLGYPTDLKSEPTYHSVRSMARDGTLSRLVVLDAADTYDLDPSLVRTPVPLDKTVPRGFYLFEDLSPVGLPGTSARDLTISLFDRFAANALGESASVHAFPSLGRTLRAAAAEGKNVVAYSPTAHPEHVMSVIREEAPRYGIDPELRNLPRVARNYDAVDDVLTISAHATRTFRERFPGERVHPVGPLGVDTGRFRPSGSDTGEFVVLAVANMRPLKGIPYLLDAWERLDVDGTLRLCGTMDAGVRDRLGSRIERLANVDHVGYVDDPAPHYREASVLVHPSLTEGFGKVIAEAMATAVPVVVTEGGPTEYVGDGEAGFVVPTRDPEAIADRLRYLYDNPDERRRMGREGRRRAEANTWAEFSDRVRDAHRAILEREGDG